MGRDNLSKRSPKRRQVKRELKEATLDVDSRLPEIGFEFKLETSEVDRASDDVDGIRHDGEDNSQNFGDIPYGVRLRAVTNAQMTGSAIAWRLRGLHTKKKMAFPTPRHVPPPLPPCRQKETALRLPAITENKVTNQRLRDASTIGFSFIQRHRRHVPLMSIPKDVAYVVTQGQRKTRARAALKSSIPMLETNDAPTVHLDPKHLSFESHNTSLSVLEELVVASADDSLGGWPTDALELSEESQEMSSKNPPAFGAVLTDRTERLPRVKVLDGESDDDSVGSLGSDKAGDPASQLVRKTSSIGLDYSSSASNRKRQHFLKEEFVGRLSIIHAVFGKLQEDGCLHRDVLPNALEALGHVNVKKNIVDEVFDGMSQYVTIDLEQFKSFISGYQERIEKAFEEEFNEFDMDGNGFIDLTELGNLLLRFSIEPMRHVLNEVIDEVDDDHNGVLSREEFRVVMDILQTREGFSKSDYNWMMDCFNHFDRDQSSEIDANELEHILNYLGLIVKQDRVTQTFRGCDIDRNGAMNRREFLMCMRDLRNTDVAALKSAFFQFDVDKDGVLTIEELTCALNHIGYYPSSAALETALELAGVTIEEVEDLGDNPPRGKRRGKMDLSDLFRVVQIYRMREGMSKGDEQEITDVFNRFAGGEDGMMMHNVGAALRCMGFDYQNQVEMLLARQVDLDNNGFLCLLEFQKLIRLCRDWQFKLLRAAFNEFDRSGRGVLTAELAIEALASVACLDVQDVSRAAITQYFPSSTESDKVIVPIIPRRSSASKTVSFGDEEVSGLARQVSSSSAADYTVDLRSFILAGDEAHRNSREFMCAQEGFARREVQELWRHYKELEQVESARSSVVNAGKINQTLIFEAIFPSATEYKDMRAELQTTFSSAHKSTESLSFQAYLRLAAKVRPMYHSFCVADERQVIQTTGFTLFEVHEYRNLFIITDTDGDDLLSFNEFKDFLATVCPINGTHTTLLKDMHSDVRKTRTSVAKSHHIDFPEFLLLLKSVQDTNFASKDHSGRTKKN